MLAYIKELINMPVFLSVSLSVHPSVALAQCPSPMDHHYWSLLRVDLSGRRST